MCVSGNGGDLTANENRLSVFSDGPQNREKAEQLAQRLGVIVSDFPGEELTLIVADDGLSLNGYGLSYRGDFLQMLRRVTGGRLQHEMLARIIKTKSEAPTAIDATAGMGEDSFLIAACGYTVTMFEQNPVIAELLKDAMQRAKADPVAADIVSRMKLVEGNSVELMPELNGRPDIIYLDPMFPARQKSGLINKKLQLIQKLEQPCVDEDVLFETAASLKPKKLVIKRPLKGEFLAGAKPGYSLSGKAIRYDCFAFSD